MIRATVSMILPLALLFAAPIFGEESVEDRVRRLDAEPATRNEPSNDARTIWGRPSIEYGPDALPEHGRSNYRSPKERAQDSFVSDLYDCSRSSTGGYLDKKACGADAATSYKSNVESLKRQGLDW